MAKAGNTELERLSAVQAAYDEAAANRDRAILAAVRAGNGLRKVAAVANCSHESIRRTLAAGAQIAFVLEGEVYAVSYHQAVELADQVARWTDEPVVDAVAERWRSAALRLVTDIRAKLDGAHGLPIVLRRDHAFALYQAMLLDSGGQTAPAAALSAALSRYFRG